MVITGFCRTQAVLDWTWESIEFGVLNVDLYRTDLSLTMLVALFEKRVRRLLYHVFSDEDEFQYL